MPSLELPIFKKTVDLYKMLYAFRNFLPREDRYGIWQRCENLAIDLLEKIIVANQTTSQEKIASLQAASLKLNTLRTCLCLTMETKILDHKKYLQLELLADEIGRMLGGWLKAAKT